MYIYEKGKQKYLENLIIYLIKQVGSFQKE